MLNKVFHHFFWHRLVEKFVRSVTIIPCLRYHSHLVLNLNHDDRMFIAIHLVNMPHQCCKCAGVRFSVFFAEQRENLYAPAFFVPRARKPLLVRLDPNGGVAGHAVLEACEPQQNKTEVVTSGVLYQAVHKREIEAALPGFYEIPINGGKDGVKVQLDKLRPLGFHVIEVRGT